ncbi:hypothetical protein MKJ04_13650 [Pontibacter sp. E15-1]|uniref:hypothetical protein n=1 Tax=Pontibacter sp. E15-1 TaxID=2919918 RepID=UPI001F4F7D69|nr:hypothetical protein [Pontibacter sp. E15-1]MCJ8165891.1 hypothetical protein [Pontibacter sp. E15-1]
MEAMYIVEYNGTFGFIKPWTAVRDEKTFSQQFLTPSIIEGLRQKLGVTAILRHKLMHAGTSLQQERTQSRAFEEKRKGGLRQAARALSIINRGIMLYPHLWLAFPTLADAELAAEQHICLSRNEDVLLPSSGIDTVSEAEFDRMPGFELLFGETPNSILVGHNRYEGNVPMYGEIRITGNPILDLSLEL